MTDKIDWLVDDGDVVRAQSSKLRTKMAGCLFWPRSENDGIHRKGLEEDPSPLVTRSKPVMACGIDVLFAIGGRDRHVADWRNANDRVAL